MDDTASFHFLFQDEIISYSGTDCSGLGSLIYEAVGNSGPTEIVIETSNSEKIQFIPDYFFTHILGSDLVIVQYSVNLATLPPNKISSPYKIYFQPFSNIKLSYNHLYLIFSL